MNAAMKVVDAVTSKMNRVGMEEVRGSLPLLSQRDISESITTNCTIIGVIVAQINAL